MQRKSTKGTSYGKKLSTFNAYEEFTDAEKDKISKDKFELIQKSFAKVLMTNLLEGEEIILPCKLGTMQIVKYKSKKHYPDYHNSEKYGMKLPHSNLHSDGYQVKMQWSRSEAHFKYKSYWSFNLSKDNKNRKELSMSKFIKKNGVHRYVELVSFKRPTK